MCDNEQFEKVCKGLECCASGNMCKNKCPYNDIGCVWTDCVPPLVADALALIRQQQARIEKLEAAQMAMVMSLEDAAKSDVCWMEDKDMDQVMPCRIRWHYNSYFIKLFVGSPERFAEKDYGTEFRCWTQRPTDEQRKAAKWE